MSGRFRWLPASVGKWLLLLAAIAATLGWLACLDRSVHVGLGAVLDGHLLPWLNALPALLLMLALLAASRKLGLSLWLTGLVTALLYAVSAVKMEVLAAPLTHQDFILIGQVIGDTSLFARYIPWGGQLALILVVAVVVTLALARWEPPLLRARKRLRLPVAAAVGVLLVTLLAGLGAWQHIYAKSAIDYRPWEAATTSSDRLGLINNIVLHGLYTPDIHGLVSDPKPGRALLRAHRDAVAQWMQHAPAAPLPDIVVLQSESYFDPAILNGYDAADWIGHFRKLQKLGQHGDMNVPTFGGGTIRTEFEVLTGLPLAFFPHLRYPYLSLDAARIPGLTRALKDAGYATLAIHPNHGGFWDRTSTFRRMGFDDFVSLEDPAFQPPQRRGFYISDKALTDVILDRLKPSGPPQFVFAISMENHGPYDNTPVAKERTAQRDAIPVPPGVDQRGALILRNYLLHQRDADRQLGRLAEALAARDRPTILAFYGDHLPGLPGSYANGFKNGKTAPRQGVPYLLIWPGQPHPPVVKNIPSWLLGSEILVQAGVRTDPWFALQHLREDKLLGAHWPRGSTRTRQWASLANLRLHNKLATAPAE